MIRIVLQYATFCSILNAAIKLHAKKWVNGFKNWKKEKSRRNLLLWYLEVHAVPQDPENKTGLDINHVIFIETVYELTVDLHLILHCQVILLHPSDL